MKDFKSKYGPWALVTGASDGIGRAVAKELAGLGINVVLVARNKTKLDELSREIETNKVQTKVISLDLSLPDANSKLFAQTAGMDIGLLCAIAGYGSSGNFLDSEISTELNMLDLNCRAVIEQAHHYGRLLKARGKGGMILMGSIFSFQGVPGSANYAATKSYTQSLAEGLHYELKPLGIDVLSAAPGPVRSGFADRADMKMSQTDQPAIVAQQILAALGHSVTVRPGPVSKLLGYSLGTLPRSLRIKMLEKVMTTMTITKPG